MSVFQEEQTTNDEKSPQVNLTVEDLRLVSVLRFGSGSTSERTQDSLAELASLSPHELAEQMIATLDGQDIEDIMADSFSFVGGTEVILAHKAGDVDDAISARQQHIRKDFALAVIDVLQQRTNGVEHQGERELLVAKVEAGLLGASPNMMDNIGGIDAQIDVAAAAQEVPGFHRAVWEARESAMQAITFSYEPQAVQDMLVDKVLQATSVEQLNLLQFYESLSQHATNAGYGEQAVEVIEGTFATIADSDSRALTSIVARQYEHDVTARKIDDMSVTGDRATELSRQEQFGLTQYFDLPEELDRYQVAHVAQNTIGLRDAYGVVRSVTQVSKVPDEFPDSRLALVNVREFMEAYPRASSPADFFATAKDFLLDKLDVVEDKEVIERTVNGHELISIIDQLYARLPRSEEVLIAEQFVPFESALPNSGSLQLELLQKVHQPVIREMLEQATGMNLADIGLDTQAQLLDYMTNRSGDEFKRLHRVTEEMNKDDTARFYEAFLATEFGDDFGDKIISIAEHTTHEQANKIFELVNKYRYESSEYANMYRAYDPELADATQLAINERLADILAVVETVARDGETTVDTAPHREQPNYRHDGKFDTTITSVDEAIDTMELLQQTFERRRLVVDNPNTTVSHVVANEDEVGYQIYRFHHDELGDTLLHVRSEGSGRYDKAFEYGNYDGVEATISWVVNPTGDHALASDKDSRGVSIRFDREGRAPGEAPDSDTRSPVRDDGMISVDISSGMGNARTAAVRIGRMIAAGNILRAAKQGTDVSLHHNTNYFDQAKYGTAKGFKELANYVQTMAETKISSRRSKKVGRRAAAVTVASPRR